MVLLNDFIGAPAVHDVFFIFRLRIILFEQFLQALSIRGVEYTLVVVYGHATAELMFKHQVFAVVEGLAENFLDIFNGFRGPHFFLVDGRDAPGIRKLVWIFGRFVYELVHDSLTVPSSR